MIFKLNFNLYFLNILTETNLILLVIINFKLVVLNKKNDGTQKFQQYFGLFCLKPRGQKLKADGESFLKKSQTRIECYELKDLFEIFGFVQGGC